MSIMNKRQKKKQETRRREANLRRVEKEKARAEARGFVEPIGKPSASLAESAADEPLLPCLMPKPEPIVDYSPQVLHMPSAAFDVMDMVPIGEAIVTHEVDPESSRHRISIGYISDIHIEHQCDLLGDSMVREKIEQMVEDIQGCSFEPGDAILFAGDTACTPEVVGAFYSALSMMLFRLVKRRVTTLKVLGNHELWDGGPGSLRPKRTLDEIIDDYRRVLGSSLLENDLFMRQKGMTQAERVIREDELLSMPDAALAELISTSSLTVLGGLGFAGNNYIFNATSGIYRASVTREQECERSARFRAVYDKVERAAGSNRVIVLTHNPMRDWSDGAYHPGWIYISGHTHDNEYMRNDDGTVVLADNQIGYERRKLAFKSFEIDSQYDPFAHYQDGIYEISPEDYQDFNRGRGISMGRPLQYKGTLYMIKRNDCYMFFLKSRSLCLLSGGKRTRVDHDLTYFFDNLPAYVDGVKRLFAPYAACLRKISEEVKSFGGTGTIHGCIVDIDYYNHIYLNPFDGTVTPYFARSTVEKLAYKSVRGLLESGPFMFNSSNIRLAKGYERSLDAGRIEILESLHDNDANPLASVPTLELDTSNYAASRNFRAVQYLIDDGVVRIWRDEILEMGDDATSRVLPSSAAALNP